MRPTKLVLLSVAALALVFLPKRSSSDKLSTKEKPIKDKANPQSRPSGQEDVKQAQSPQSADADN